METATFVLTTTIVMLIITFIIYTVLTSYFLGKGVKQNELALSKKDIFKISIVVAIFTTIAYYVTSYVINLIITDLIIFYSKIPIIADFDYYYYSFTDALLIANKWIPLMVGIFVYYKTIRMLLVKQFYQTEKTIINEIVNRTTVSVSVTGILVGIFIIPLIRGIASMIMRGL